MKRKLFLACLTAMFFIGGCAQNSAVKKQAHLQDTSTSKSKHKNCGRDDSTDIVTCKKEIPGVLMWQDTPNTPLIGWQQAKDYCENLNLAGFIDWKLPARTELMSIIDYDDKNRALNGAFKNFDTKNSKYWSATVRADSFSVAWSVSFDNGNAHWDKVSKNNTVRCVRAAN
ncbi:MAG: DUF1566 domain-containing protein [Campylobacter sp.]|uniref:Lcl C-terminal domain-containing protein n=1 Tax=Campylobacter sp. TaxID=205 RepID=UPI003FA11DED